jgi:glucokinase
VFVIGGGVSESGDLLLASARSTLTEKIIGQGNRPAPEVRIAELANSAGVVGAADLAR